MFSHDALRNYTFQHVFFAFLRQKACFLVTRHENFLFSMNMRLNMSISMFSRDAPKKKKKKKHRECFIMTARKHTFQHEN